MVGGSPEILIERLMFVKKIELHCHLDGSVNRQLASKLLGRTVAAEEMTCIKGTESLSDYLRMFHLPVSLLQTEENLAACAEALAQDLVQDEVIYAEIRFCPLLHVDLGLTIDAVIEAVLAGLAKVPTVRTNLILCTMRNLYAGQNEQILQAAARYFGKGVCAVDLAGDEASAPNDRFMWIFRDCCDKYRIPLTVHGGEASGPESILAALDGGAQRIGHGVRAIESEEVVKQLVYTGTPIEVCVKSNLDTGIYDLTIAHPIRRLMEAGVAITINTDNRTVSGCDLKHEYHVLREFHRFTEEEFLHCNLMAVQAAFTDAETKVALHDELLADYRERMYQHKIRKEGSAIIDPAKQPLMLPERVIPAAPFGSGLV